MADSSILPVERNEVSVERTHIQLVALDSEPAVHHSAAHAEPVRKRSLVMPDLTARSGIQRPGMIKIPSNVHNAVE